MRDLAAALIIIAMLVGILLTVAKAWDDSNWAFRRSPATGVCYEIRDSVFLLGFAQAMSAVDDKWCEE